MPSFIAIIVGGVGSLTGTLLGGLLIGVASALTTIVWPAGKRGGDLRHHGGGAADPPTRPDGRGRHADMNSATVLGAAVAACRTALAAGHRHLGGPAHRAAVAAVAWRLHGTRRPRAGAGPRGDGIQILFGLHRGDELRSRRVFRPGRIRRRADVEISRRIHPLGDTDGHAAWRLAGTLFGLLIVRRRGVYFAMVTVAFGQIAFYIAYSWNDLTGGYDGLRGFVRAPHPSRPGGDRHHVEPERVLLFPAVRLRDCRRVDGLHPAFAVWPHAGCHSRERAPRPLPRHPHRAPYLAVVLDFLLLHRTRRRLVCAAQQFRRSDGAALLALWRNRDHDCDGRYARLLGSAARRRSVRGAAGLHFLNDRRTG